MKEIKIYARAGQGAITTASILGQALFLKGKYAYAFPHFGAARMGAAMNAFVRVDDKPIRLRSQIYEPDYVMIVDSTLMRGSDCFAGFKSDGIALVNEREGIEVPKAKAKQKIFIVPANKIAQEVIGKPLGNTALIGAFAAATGELDFDSVSTAIKERFAGKIADLNIEAAKRGFEYIKKQK
ncbi:MAG: pyruvate ferredoxin oxidoreductase [Candidatus Omnitrophica bacterium]|nr:pyruvate ferredoxin oxidoreductase [Candidatus Omnitrophota bacterium]